MLRELYTRQIDDPLYDKYTIEERTELGAILAKIRMILGTENGEVMGDYSLGVDLEGMIFNTKMSQGNIERMLMDQISKYVNYSEKYKISVSVKFGHHRDGYDYGIVEIGVNDGIAQRYMFE